ncbi:MAG: hypothetical protein C4289_12740, partial [Chloroflexota bacterium]
AYRACPATLAGSHREAPVDVLTMLTEWRQYFLDEPGPITWAWASLVTFFATALLATLFFTYIYGIMLDAHRLHRGINRRILYWGAGLNALGLGLLFWRLLGWGLLNRRIFPFAVLLTEVALLVYALYYMHTTYRIRLAEYRAEEERRRYLPRPKAETAARRRRR